MTLAFTAPEARLSEIVTRYELPEEGITLLGYIVRRMHVFNKLKEPHFPEL